MSLVINTNVAALNAYNNLNNNQAKLENAFEQLSSGLRINKAADDASGLSIAQGLTSQINGLTQAVSNANDATNVAQIADGSLGTAQDILQRMRTLVVQAGNAGTQDSTSLGAIQQEITNLNDQLNNISSQTKFGSTNLLDGKYNGVFQVGANGGDTITLKLDQSVDSTKLGVASGSGSLAMSLSGSSTTSGLNIMAYKAGGYTGVDYDTATSKFTAEASSGATYTSAQAAADLQVIDAAINQVSDARSQIGAVQKVTAFVEKPRA